MTVLAGARLVTPSGIVGPGWLRVESGRIVGLGSGTPPERPTGEPFEEVVALEGLWVLPGFIDVHVHGGGGASFTDGDPDEVVAAVAFHRGGGTTRAFASLVTAPPDDLLDSVARLAELADDGLIAGIHLEGPFLSSVRCGAQDPRFLLAPDRGLLARLLTAGRGHVRMVTLAPELTGALDLVRQVVAGGALAALGHSDATYDQALAAVDAGATVATHLFNGMRPLHHREPGIVGVALDRPEVTCELIGDGQHLHEAALRLAFAAAPGRVALVTDAISAAGAGDGVFRLGPVSVTVEGGRARLNGHEVFAGSTITMAEAVRHAVVDARLPIDEVVGAASTRPAQLIGVDGAVGTIEEGRIADLVVCDAGFGVAGVMVAGVWATAPAPATATERRAAERRRGPARAMPRAGAPARRPR